MIFDIALYVVGVLVCTINIIYISRLVSCTERKRSADPKKQRSIFQRNGNKLRVYRIEYAIVVIHTLLCLLLMALTKLFDFPLWLIYIALAISLVVTVMICITHIIFSNSESREKTKEEAIKQVVAFFVFLVVGAMIIISTK